MVATRAIQALGLAAGLILSFDVAADCYHVCKGDKLVYRASRPPVDLSGSISEAVREKYGPDAVMVAGLDGVFCPEDNAERNLGEVTIAAKRSPLYAGTGALKLDGLLDHHGVAATTSGGRASVGSDSGSRSSLGSGSVSSAPRSGSHAINPSGSENYQPPSQ